MKTTKLKYVFYFLMSTVFILTSCEKAEEPAPTGGTTGGGDCNYIQSTETGTCSSGYYSIFPGLCCSEDFPFSTLDCDGCYATCEAAASNCGGSVYRANIDGSSGETNYSCVNGNCVSSTNGQYGSLSECQNSCGSGSQGLSYQSCSMNDPYELIVNPDNHEYEGVLCISGVQDSENGLDVGQIEFKFEFNTFWDEPVERAFIRWQSDNGNTDFNTIKVRSKVYTADGTFTGWYHFKSPLVSDAPSEWSYDVSGSPDWDEVFENINRTQYASGSFTQSLFDNGFYLDNFTPISINGVDYE